MKNTNMRRLRQYGALAGLTLLTTLTARTAFAQAMNAPGVQVYGLVGTYVDRIKRADATPAIWQVGSGGLTTSYLGFRGREDLGGGLNAIFAIEGFFQPDTGISGRSASDTMWGRNAYVGLTGSAGTVALGRQTNPTYIAMSMLSPFGNSVVFSPLTLQTFVATYGGQIVGDTVWSNAIQYTTPTLWGGTTGSAIYSFGERSGQRSIADTGLHVRSTVGNFSGAVSWQRTRIGEVAPQTSQRVILAGGNYDFKVVKVFASGVRTDTEGTRIKTTTWDAGVSIPVGGLGAVWVEYARTRRDNPVIADTTRQTASLAYDHRLSRRTDVYAIYSRDALTGFSAGNTYGFGVRHSF
jgi:predicted porin